MTFVSTNQPVHPGHSTNHRGIHTVPEDYCRACIEWRGTVAQRKRHPNPITEAEAYEALATLEAVLHAGEWFEASADALVQWTRGTKDLHEAMGKLQWPNLDPVMCDCGKGDLCPLRKDQ